MKVYWGDLHNHCAVSYGQGTAERALDNARQHLDFCSITGHAFWPDMPMDLSSQNAIIGMHLGGFAKLQHFWPDLLRTLERYNEPGRFLTLPSYEWHSLRFGDYNCYSPNFDLPLMDAPDLPSLAARVAEGRRDFFLLPHHCGYTQGFRGTNWDSFDESISPLAEIYSNHGCGEADDAPYDYYHSMGPRTGESLIRGALASGHRFGFYASTDSHDGYPGHYGHGKVGVIAEKLEMPAIWEALAARRTIASTGARIIVHFTAGEGGPGQTIRRRARHPLAATIEGAAPLESIELIEGGDGSWRRTQLPGPVFEQTFTPGRYKVRIEVGWGRGNQRSIWRIRGRIIQGRLLAVEPCFRFSGESTSHVSTEKVVIQGGQSFDWRAQAAANPAGAMGGTHFNTGGTQSIVLDLLPNQRCRLQLELGDERHDLRIADLARGSFARQIAGFGSPAFKVHRAIPEREFACTVALPCYRPYLAKGRSFAYLRIRQTDGHAAWVSPIWFE